MQYIYRIDAVRELLSTKVEGATKEEKVRLAEQAEVLFWRLEPSKNYSMMRLCEEIPELSSASNGDTVYAGELICQDLSHFISEIIASADIFATEIKKPLLTARELAEILGVSEKTIARWHQKGMLPGFRCCVPKAKRKHWYFFADSVDLFIMRNEGRIAQGGSLSQMSTQLRRDILASGKTLQREGKSLEEITSYLSQKFRRSSETIALLLGRLVPEETAFQKEPAKVTQEPVPEEKVSVVESLDLRFVANEKFEETMADVELEAETLSIYEEDAPAKHTKPPSDLPAYLKALYEVPLLSAGKERHLFRKMNYLKYKADYLRLQLLGGALEDEATHEQQILSLHKQSGEVKNELIRANLRLVVSISKRYITRHNNFYELVSDGNVSLVRAVELFDFFRGNKFSTYATWAIMKNFSRIIPIEKQRLARFQATEETRLSGLLDERTSEPEEVVRRFRYLDEIEVMLEQLPVREQEVILRRFGIGSTHPPMTLLEVGREMGITKERVRQIELRAMTKLRNVAAERGEMMS